MPLHFCKAFEVPRDFSRKVPCVGVWGDAPTDNAHEKTRRNPRFLFCQDMLELRSKPCFKRLFVKSPLKIRKNFPRLPHFILAKLLRFQRTFHEKSLVSGVGRLVPISNAYTKKARHCRAFYISLFLIILFLPVF